MGLLETLWQNVTTKTVCICVVGGWTVWWLVDRIDEHLRLKKLGNYGPQVYHKLPWGLDFIATSVRYTWANNNIEFWREYLFNGGSRSTVTTRILGQRVVFTSDVENVKAMLATQFSDFGKGEPFREEWREFLGESIFTTDGHQWQHNRQMLRPQFSKDRVSDLRCFEDHFQTLIKVIANGGPLDGENQEVDLEKANGRVLDISAMLFRFSLDVTTDFLLGQDAKSMSSVENRFATAFNEVQRIQNVIARTGRLRYIWPKWTFRRNLKVVNAFVQPHIDRALAMTPGELEMRTKSDEGYTFLHELAKSTRNPVEIRDQIMSVLLAGRDTTAAILSWTIYELSRSPEVVEKLKTEISEFVGGSKELPTYEHLKNMPYVKAIFNEVLRLYPGVPFNVRLALKDTTLPRGGGPDGSEPLPVLKNTPCGYSTLILQRNPEMYPPISEDFADPKVFSPERWAKWHPKPHEYIPFNAGPRICIGQQFALTEMSYILVRMFQTFDRVESHMFDLDGGVPVLKSDITLSPGQGVKVSFHQDGPRS